MIKFAYVFFESNELIRVNYKSLIHELTIAVEGASYTLEQLHSLVLELKDVELLDPEVTEASAPPERIKRALAEAKAAADVFGHESNECLHAWDEVEGIIKGVKELDDHHYRYTEKAVIDHPHDYSAVVDLQSIKDFIEAIATIRHTGKLLRLEDQRLFAKEKRDDLLP